MQDCAHNRLIRGIQMKNIGWPARGAAALAVAAISMSVHAQPGGNAPPPGLKWEWMREAILKSSDKETPTASPQEQEMLRRIWSTELAQPDTRLGATLVGQVTAGGNVYVLSIMTRGFDVCEPSANGRDATTDYWRCPLRVVRLESDGKGATQDFPDYCIAWGNYPDLPRSRNHVEYAFDAANSTVHFRTLQHGKVEAPCSRSLRLPRG